MNEEATHHSKEPSYSAGPLNGFGKTRFRGASPWTISLTHHLSTVGTLTIRNVRRGDDNNLKEFGEGLTSNSRNLFSPYPWGTGSAAAEAFSLAIERNASRIDATYLALLGARPVGHFVLWGLRYPQYIRGVELCVPTLGIAIVDDFHGRGIGTNCLHLLKSVCSGNGIDAIELTTAPQNLRAARLYKHFGFIEIGLLDIPLGVDPSTPIDECRDVAQWRTERHMYYPLNSETEKDVATFLADKACSYHLARADQ